MKYRKAISLVIKKDDKYLIVNSKSWPTNTWCFVQGGINQGEDELTAIAREIKEEIGACNYRIIKKSPISHKYTFPPEIQKKKGFIGQEQSIWFVDFLDDFNNIDISHGELRSYKWVKKNDILQHFAFPEQKDTFKKVLELE